MMQKPTIIITSLGRTGTKFFATLFANLLPNSTALHEPDVLGIERDQGVQDILRQMDEGGLVNMTVRKLFGEWSLIRISDARLTGQLTTEKALSKLVAQRHHFIAGKPGNLYVESNSGFYGLIDLLPQAFTHHRLAYILRDGRSWVQSWMNWGHLYDKGLLRRQVAHTWPTADQLPDDPFHHRWSTMSRFERICWAWTTLNRFSLMQIDANPHARLYRFEDIFASENRYDHLGELVTFVTSMPSCPQIERPQLGGWLDRPIHQSTTKFPAYTDWTETQKEQFHTICGPLMAETGYAH